MVMRRTIEAHFYRWNNFHTTILSFKSFGALSCSSISNGNLHRVIFLEILNVTTFGIQSNCNSKYELPIKLQLKFFHNLCILSFGCKQEYHFVIKMLTWLHWKFAYTWPTWIHLVRVGVYINNLTLSSL